MPRVSARTSSRKGGGDAPSSRFQPRLHERSRAFGEQWERNRALRDQLTRWLMLTRSEIAETLEEMHKNPQFAEALGDREKSVVSELEYAIDALEEALFSVPEPRVPEFVKDLRWTRTKADGPSPA